MKVIRKSVVFILVLAAPLYAGASLPSANRFPAGADPFAGQRGNGPSYADQMARDAQQREAAKAADNLRRQADEIEAQAAKHQKEIAKLQAKRNEMQADLPREFTKSTDGILRQGRGKQLEYFTKVHQATMHVFALLGDAKEIFGDGSPQALAKAKAAFQSVMRTATAIQSAATKVTTGTEESQAISAFQQELEALISANQPKARALAALNAEQDAKASTLRDDIKLWIGIVMDPGAPTPEAEKAHDEESKS